MKNDLNEDFNHSIYESVMPGMTVEQALYINGQPYGTFPKNVQSKAVAILDSWQRSNHEKTNH